MASCRWVRPDFRTSSNSSPLASERAAQIRRTPASSAGELREHAEPDRRRNHVVGRLRHVDVIVRDARRVLAALAAEDLVGAIGQHLVRRSCCATCRRRPGTDRRRTGRGAARRALRRRPRRSRRRASASSRPVSLCVSAARLLDPDQRVDERRERAEAADRKVLPARSVWTPYSASAGTSSGPRGSFSRRVSAIVSIQ